MNGLTLLCFLFCLAPAAQAGVDLKTYVNIYYLAEEKMAAFDRELSGAVAPGFLARSKTYRDLLALRALKDSEEHSLREAMLALSNGPSAPFEELLKSLRSLDPAERVALNDIVTSLRMPANRSLPVFYANLAQLLDARKAAASFATAHSKAAQKDTALAKRLASVAIDFSSRGAPPLDRIRPGAGPEGTVNGSQFPLGTWALTFDDGPHITRTKEIFENLKALKKKATFFWLVECLETVPGIAIEGISLGYSVNNHSWTHLNLDKATAEVNKKEIVQSTERDEEYFNQKPRFFRLPYGAGVSNKAVRQLIADQGMIHVLWNVDSLDWQDKDPTVILERTKKLMALEKRGIILFHDIHAQSVEASKQLLKYSATLEGTAQAHKWVTLPEIVDQLNKSDLLGDLQRAKAPRKRAAVFPLDRKPVLR